MCVCVCVCVCRPSTHVHIYGNLNDIWSQDGGKDNSNKTHMHDIFWPQIKTDKYIVAVQTYSYSQ
jgi:hypothetical protein